MKLAYISSSVIPSRSANSIHVIRMAEAFSDLGHQVVLLAPHHDALPFDSVGTDWPRYYDVRTHFTLKKLKMWPLMGLNTYPFNVIRELSRVSPEIVYGRSIEGCLASAIAGWRVALELHAPIPESNTLQKFAFNALKRHKNLCYVTCISKALRTYFIEQQGLSPEQIWIAHDGAREASTALENRANLKGGGDLAVGYVGGFYPGKGLELISKISRELKAMDFHLVGGTLEDALRFGFEPKQPNVFFYGRVEPAEVPSYINTFDICLVPNQKEVFGFSSRNSARGTDIGQFCSPLKLFEYMSFGKAMVVSKLSNLQEVVDESCAVLARADSVEEWISAIVSLRSKELRKNIGSAARSRFSEQYTWTARAKGLINRFETRHD